MTRAHDATVLAQCSRYPCVFADSLGPAVKVLSPESTAQGPGGLSLGSSVLLHRGALRAPLRGVLRHHYFLTKQGVLGTPTYINAVLLPHQARRAPVPTTTSGIVEDPLQGNAGPRAHIYNHFELMLTFVDAASPIEAAPRAHNYTWHN